MRVILLTGKGGVGKTSHAVATALGAAAHGHRVFLLSTDPAHSVGDALDRRVGARPVEVAPRVVAREVSALEELDRSWSAIQEWLRALLRDETDEILADELLVFPGLEELLALRAVREVEETGDFDVCVVDCAPTGATLRMLRSDAAHAAPPRRPPDLHAELLRHRAPRRAAAASAPRPRPRRRPAALGGLLRDLRTTLPRG
jgi:arsenite-transporting ATPase